MTDPEAVEIIYLQGKYGLNTDLELARLYELAEQEAIQSMLIQNHDNRLCERFCLEIMPVFNPYLKGE